MAGSRDLDLLTVLCSDPIIKARVEALKQLADALSDRVVVLTPRPGRVAKEYPVPFPRPRSLEIMATKEVFDLTNAIKMDIVGGRIGAKAKPALAVVNGGAPR